MLHPNSTFRLISEKYPRGTLVFRAYFDQSSENGKTVRHWTGVKDDGKAQSRAAAHRAAQLWLDQGCPSRTTKTTPLAKPSRGPLVDDLGAKLWDWDESWYLKEILSRDAKAFCQETVDGLRGCYKNHVAPVIGQVPIVDVTPKMLDRLITDLLLVKRRSKQTAKHVIQSMKPIFEEACGQCWIERNPIRSMLPFAVDAKTRDEFTLEETKTLFCWETVMEVWTPPPSSPGKGGAAPNYHPHFEPLRAYTIALLAALTSTRVGTILALHREDIQLSRRGNQVFYTIDFKKKLTTKGGVKPGTKTGTGTSVPVLCDYLDLVLPHLPASGPLFPSKGLHGIYTAASARRMLHSALSNVGIGEEVRRARLLGFHSFRHTFVTQSASSGLSTQVQSGFTEHRDERSRKRYTHTKATDLLPALKVQKLIVSGQGGKSW